jgi:glycosyltransferase involved in cell wall biosynthesis
MIRPGNQPRVLHVLTVPDSLVFLRGQVPFMHRAGFWLGIVTSPGGDLERFGHENGVPVWPVTIPRAIAPWADLVAFVRLVRLMHHIRPEIVHAHTPKAGFLGMLAAVTARVPRRIYHMRGLPLETATGWRRRLLLQTERLTCRIAHRVLCVSPSLRAVALRERIVTNRKVRVIGGGSGNGVDATGRFDPSACGEIRESMRRQLAVPADAIVVSFVGRLARDKGIATLAEAWVQIRSRHPRVFLLMLGSLDARDSIDANVLSMLGADERVRRLAHLEDVSGLYAASDILVLPSHREGFPNVALEAAAMGLPVVTTDATGCVDAVIPGQTGAIFPMGDADALVVALMPYILDARRRRRHGAAGRQRVLAQFQREIIWNGILRTYGVLLRWRKPDPAHRDHACPNDAMRVAAGERRRGTSRNAISWVNK